MPYLWKVQPYCLPMPAGTPGKNTSWRNERGQLKESFRRWPTMHDSLLCSEILYFEAMKRPIMYRAWHANNYSTSSYSYLFFSYLTSADLLLCLRSLGISSLSMFRIGSIWTESRDLPTPKREVDLPGVFNEFLQGRSSYWILKGIRSRSFALVMRFGTARLVVLAS